MTTLDRKPLQIVEIDIDYCANTYGGAPCTAALSADTPNKCFNTYFTCQDTANFTTSTLTLRFAQNITGLPISTLVYPALAGPVRTNGAQINLGGVGERVGSLGKRARVEVTLQDFTDSDIYLDKYQTGRIDGTASFTSQTYTPGERGTFFARLRRRFPYYVGRALRVLEGYEGDALASMRTRHYIISEWVGPDVAGRVKITAKDILDLADNAKALCPTPSRGKIETDISAGFTGAVNLVPAGVGAEYSASGRISIGSEIMTFTRSTDVLTITGRGIDGSTAATHSADDLVQECYRTEDTPIQDVVADLLQNYAGVSASFLPTTDWDTEVQNWAVGLNLTATISKPTGVSKLLSEIVQHGIFLWWDDIAQEVKLRVNRPLDVTETPFAVSDAENIIEGSLTNEDLHEKRITRVLFWHGVLDATETGNDGNHYRRLYVAIDTNAESANEYNETKVFEIFSRWFGAAGDDSNAAAIAIRLRNRYRDTPREVKFAIDVKDEASMRLADLITVSTRVLQDETGAVLPEQMQVSAVEESMPGHKLMVTAQSYDFANRYGVITENGRSDYASSNAAEKTKGTYIVGASGKFGDGTGPYHIF